MVSTRRRHSSKGGRERSKSEKLLGAGESLLVPDALEPHAPKFYSMHANIVENAIILLFTIARSHDSAVDTQ